MSSCISDFSCSSVALASRRCSTYNRISKEREGRGERKGRVERGGEQKRDVTCFCKVLGLNMAKMTLDVAGIGDAILQALKVNSSLFWLSLRV